MITKPRTPYKPKGKPFGLGDLVAAAAKPVVVVSDAVFGTDLRNCERCNQDRVALNNMVPNLNPFR